MKITIKQISLIFILLLLANCSIPFNFAIIGYSLGTAILPDPYKPKREGENSFPENNKAIVSLNFKSTSSYNGVSTIWRRVNEDGTFSGKKKFTYVEGFLEGRRESMIEPGTYFLDGIFFQYGNGAAMEGAFLNLYAIKPRGWDMNKNEPLWFSFTVNKKEELVIPDVIVSAYCKNNKDSCSGDDFKLDLKFDNGLDYTDQKNFKIGYKAKIN